MRTWVVFFCELRVSCSKRRNKWQVFIFSSACGRLMVCNHGLLRFKLNFKIFNTKWPYYKTLIDWVRPGWPNIFRSYPSTQSISTYYYMASSVSGQDEPNRTLWLATRAGKMEPSCPLGNTRCIPQAKFPLKPYNKSFIDQVCSVKMAGYWPPSFFRVYGPRLRLGP